MSKTHYRLQNNIHAMFEELSSRRYFPLKKKRTKIERKKKDGERRKTKKKGGGGRGEELSRLLHVSKWYVDCTVCRREKPLHSTAFSATHLNSEITSTAT